MWLSLVVLALATLDCSPFSREIITLCFGGPNIPVNECCLYRFDADGDGDVDLRDYAAWEVCRSDAWQEYLNSRQSRDPAPSGMILGKPDVP